jgi:hypothetical protein
MKLCWFMYLFSCVWTTVLSAKVVEIRVQAPENPNDQRPLYFRNMLQLALDKTAKSDGPAKWVLTRSKAMQGRNIVNLEQGRDLDVIWTMTNKERERRLLPVRIPLYKGLFGYRICLIRQGDEKKFSSVKTLADLKSSKYSIGSGIDWPDTEILKANKLNVFAGSTYEGLFRTLSKGRFDCYARAVPEPWGEVKSRPSLNLVVEKHIAFKYKTAMYFFVNKKNKLLADRLERGLRIAISDGSFDNVFYTENEKYLRLANIKKRNILPLKNPILPEKTPVADTSLWLSF